MKSPKARTWAFAGPADEGVRLDARWIGTLMDSNSAMFCDDGSWAIRVDGGLFTQW